MKIVHFLWALQNGGAENLAVDLANEQSRDSEVTLLIANNRIDNTVRARIAPTVQFICVGRPEGSRNPYWILKLLFLLHRIAPQVIHAHSDNLAKLSRFISAKLVLTVHDTHLSLSAAATRFALVCCISEAVLIDVRSRYQKLRVRQVNNGVMTSQIASRNRQVATVVRGIQVSRLVHEKKGQDLLIRALVLVNSQPNQPKLMLDFVGEGPSLTYLHALAVDTGVIGYCRFVGPMSRSDIYEKLCSYDVLVQPSRYEGFGLTVAEGMAAGISVVVSDIEGPMEIIAKGKYGLFFKNGDVSSLAETLQQAIASIGTTKESGRLSTARNHVIENFDLAQTARHYSSIYDEVTNG
jgi:glycosyltransferase involved in cell wall biosynthesis